jgi:hypothetical protein
MSKSFLFLFFKKKYFLSQPSKITGPRRNITKSAAAAAVVAPAAADAEYSVAEGRRTWSLLLWL